MTLLVAALISVLSVWLLACAACGFHQRLVGFVAVVCAGLALNACWMVFGLAAHPFERNALIAQGSACLYAFCAFGVGWFMGRVRRAWNDSRI